MILSLSWLKYTSEHPSDIFCFPVSFSKCSTLNKLKNRICFFPNTAGPHSVVDNRMKSFLIRFLGFVRVSFVWPSKYCPQTEISVITWVLVRNSTSSNLSNSLYHKLLSVGSSNLCFINPVRKY